MEREFLCFAAVAASLFTCCFAYGNGTVPAIIWHGMGLYFNRTAEQHLKIAGNSAAELLHFIFLGRIYDFTFTMPFCAPYSFFTVTLAIN